MLCNKFQTKQGCTQKNSQCPDGRLHTCAFQLSSGILCAGQQHGKANCTIVKDTKGNWEKKGKKGADKSNKGDKGGRGGRGGYQQW